MCNVGVTREKMSEYANWEEIGNIVSISGWILRCVDCCECGVRIIGRGSVCTGIQ